VKQKAKLVKAVQILIKNRIMEGDDMGMLY